MSFYFEYNKHMVAWAKRNDTKDFHSVHLTSVKWLYDNLQNGRDFMFAGEHAGKRGKSILIVQEMIWFDKQEDLLAFRLATGL